MANYLTYTRFYEEVEAEEWIRLLKENNISYELVKERNHLDNVYIGQVPEPLYSLKIPQHSFSRLNKVFGEMAERDFQSASKPHYFSDFNSNELEAVLAAPDEWNAYDLKMAHLFLGEQAPETLSRPDYKRLYRPDSIAFNRIILGYLMCFLSIGGVVAGLAIVHAKRALPDGTQVHIYDQKTLTHGRLMITLGSLMTSFYLLILLRSYWI